MLNRRTPAVILARVGRYEEVGNVRWWLRTVAVCAAVGLGVGLVVGGTLGWIFMRLVFLAKEDTLGLETSMGAIIGEFTSGGTVFIYVFGAIVGVALGVTYAVARSLLPSGTRTRTILFTLGTTAFMLGQIVRSNREDFSILPVTLSLLFVIGSVALTAAPLPILVERLAPDRERRPGRLAHGVVALGMAGSGVFAVAGIAMAYAA